MGAPRPALVPPTDGSPASAPTSSSEARPGNGGTLIVLTAPLTETIDHAGYFIQMALASLPVWMEGVINRKYPTWRDVECNADGSARYMPAGVRVLEASLLRRFPAEDIVCCYPDDLDKFIGPDTRVVAVSTHNPLGVTFAAGVYTSIFGSARSSRSTPTTRGRCSQTIKAQPVPPAFQGDRRRLGRLADRPDQRLGRTGRRLRGRGPQRIGRDAGPVRQGASAARRCPARSTSHIRRTATSIIFPDKRTTFGVVEMTTGCGRRCQFCVPDLNPQIDLPEGQDHGGRARQRPRRQQADLAGHRGHVHLGPGAHGHAVLLPESRGAAGSVRRASSTRRASSSTCSATRRSRRRSWIRVLIEKLSEHAARQEPDPPAAAEHSSREEGARAADRPRNRVGAAWPSRSCRARACRSRSTSGRASSSAASRC